MKQDGLTTAQVAEQLGVSPITVRVWCRRGLFPNAFEEETPFGSYWKIPKSDLEGFQQPKMGRPRKVARTTNKADDSRRGKRRRNS